MNNKIVSFPFDRMKKSIGFQIILIASILVLLIPFTSCSSGVSSADPDWSPDGSKIAFDSRQNGYLDIWVMNADGSEPGKLTNGEAEYYTPVWSPDGTKMAFEAFQQEADDIWVMNANGSDPRNLTNSSNDESHPCWAPDGTKIAFVARVRKSRESSIWVMNSDGSNQVRITDDTAENIDPDWSPDGSKIAFCCIIETQHCSSN